MNNHKWFPVLLVLFMCSFGSLGSAGAPAAVAKDELAARNSECGLLTAQSAKVQTDARRERAVVFKVAVDESYDKDGIEYFWDFGDGTMSTDRNPVHAYPADGLYTWSLTVRAGATTCVSSGPVLITSESQASVWQPLNSGTSQTVWDVHFTSPDEGWAAGSSAVLLHTSNGGASWPPVVVPGVSSSQGYYSVRFLDQNTGWAGAPYSWIRTTNRGASWTVTTDGGSSPPASYRLFPVSSTVAWGARYESGTGCRNLGRYTMPLGGGLSTLAMRTCPGPTPYDIYFVDQDNGWTVGSSGTIHRISNGSAQYPSWPTIIAQSSGTTQWLKSIRMLDLMTGWIVGDGGTILHTVDGGATWVPQTSGTSTDLNNVHFLNAYQGWAVGDGGLILSTTDGGATWTPEASGVTTNLWGICMITPDLGYASGTGGTILKKAPACNPASITSHPSSQTISNGQSATLSVSADGTAPLNYQWYRGLTGDTSTPVGTNSSTYVTPPLTATTNYWVRVSNACGSANSNTATITVTSGCVPPSITVQPQNTTVGIGQSAALAVAATGTTPLNYQWYQGASGDTSFPVGANSSTHTTPPLSANASYWVRVSNACGSVNSFTATVTVSSGCVPPSIALQPQSTTVTSGQSVTLSVVANGTAPLFYQWYQGTTGDTSDAVGTNSNVFVTPPLTSTSSFWVQVANPCGAANSTTATITVGASGGPVITRIKSRTSKPGSAATIYGSGFSPDKTKNIVYFGKSKGTVNSASPSRLKVSIPKKLKKGTVSVYAVVDGTKSNTVPFVVK
ncbi:MAG: YCF48-related protein [Acidobacteriota bacterium]